MFACAGKKKKYIPQEVIMFRQRQKTYFNVFIVETQSDMRETIEYLKNAYAIMDATHLKHGLLHHQKLQINYKNVNFA